MADGHLCASGHGVCEGKEAHHPREEAGQGLNDRGTCPTAGEGVSHHSNGQQHPQALERRPEPCTCSPDSRSCSSSTWGHWGPERVPPASSATRRKAWAEGQGSLPLPYLDDSTLNVKWEREELTKGNWEPQSRGRCEPPRPKVPSLSHLLSGPPGGRRCRSPRRRSVPGPVC